MAEKKTTENTNTRLLIGARIKAARKAKGMSQENLAEKLGVSFQAVSTWEQGRYIPDSDHLPALAKELDLSLDALFAEEEHPWELKPVNFEADHMFTFVKGRAQLLDMPQTLEVQDPRRTGEKEQTRFRSPLCGPSPDTGLPCPGHGPEKR